MNSPLQLEASHLIHLSIRRTSLDQVVENDTMEVKSECAHRMDSGRHWSVLLKIGFGGTEETPTAPVAGHAEIEGFFVVNESFPEEKIEQLVTTNGASILFGSLREMIAGLSGRTSNGTFLLPSVSFYQAPTTSKS